MASAEQSPSSDIIFRGTDGNECEAFVVAIRDLAFAEGKEEDCRWMLHYATTRLRGKALRWHAKLDPSIRKDWDLFVQAIFEEYHLVEESDAGEIATPVWTSTTFSPAPSIATLPGNDVLHTTTPQATTEEVGSEALEGVRFPGSLPLGGVPVPPQATNNIQEALCVTFISSSGSHQIGCVNARELSTRNLGVCLYPLKVSKFHPLVGTWGSAVPSPNCITTVGTPVEHQTVSTVWTILNDGTLLVTLSDLISDCSSSNDAFGYGIQINQSLSESCSTTNAYVEISGLSISFTKDCNTSPQALHPTSGSPIVRARIVFEPV